MKLTSPLRIKQQRLLTLYCVFPESMSAWLTWGTGQGHENEILETDNEILWNGKEIVWVPKEINRTPPQKKGNAFRKPCRGPSALPCGFGARAVQWMHQNTITTLSACYYSPPSVHLRCRRDSVPEQSYECNSILWQHCWHATTMLLAPICAAVGFGARAIQWMHQNTIGDAKESMFICAAVGIL